MSLITTVFLFVYFALCGRCSLAIFNVKLGHIRNGLLSPSLGLSVNVLLVLILNQAGLPVATFARPLVLGLVMISIAVVWWRRGWRMRGLGPFAMLGLAVLALGAWPMLKYGFNWVSYGNDDMTNYCLGAQRVLNNGFYRVPLLSELAGRDYSQFFWFMHVAYLIRPGSELVLAEVAGAIGRPPVEIFMPVIFSIAITQLWALGALIYTCPRKKLQALLASAFLAVSPLWIYGTLHQLIAQVSGLALLLATLALASRNKFAASWAGRIKQASMVCLPASGIAITYPEVIPFLILTLVLYTAIFCFQKRRLIRDQLPVALLSVAGVFLLLRHNSLSTFTTLLGQTTGGLIQEDISQTIFPYFLIPKGSAFLLGLDAIVAIRPEPWGAICIGASLVVLFLVLSYSVNGTRLFQTTSCLFMVMVALAAKLFLGNNGFGLFKLAMFSTPVLAAEMAGAVLATRTRWFIAGASITLGCVWTIEAQQYVRASTPIRNNLFLEIPEASLSRGQMPINSEILVSDITSSPVAKIAAAANNASITFLSRPFFKGIMEMKTYVPPRWAWNWMPDPEVPRLSADLVRQANTNIFVAERAFNTVFWSPPGDIVSNSKILLTSTAETKSFNKLYQPAANPEQLFTQVPVDGLRNYLVFVHSAAGQHYYLGETGSIGAYKPQPDVYSPSGSFFAIGRKLVFQVLNPSQTIRVRMSITTSLLGLGRTRLPEKAVVQGEQSRPFPLGIRGSGGANVYSAPFTPLRLNGRSYVAIDLLRKPAHFTPAELPGLNSLYNSEVRLDPRLMNGYCRDVSVISDADYARMKRPTSVLHFPQDLVEQPNLEYSGLYEDGWISCQAFVILGAAEPGQKIVIRGMVPQLPDASLRDNTVEVQINGKFSLSTHLSSGNFELICPIEMAAKTNRLDLHFSKEGHLPSNDQRPVAALLTSLAIKSEN